MKYDLCFGIGENCDMSFALRRRGLQIASYPFDWLANSEFEKDLDIVLNEFDKFFEKEDLEKLEGESINRSAKYMNKRNNLHFVHDFPLESNFEDYYDSVRIKYEKRSKRLLTNIKNSKRVLIAFVLHRDNPLQNVLDVVSKYKSLLNDKYPNVVFDFIYIMNTQEQDYTYENRKLNLKVFAKPFADKEKVYNILGIKFAFKNFEIDKCLDNCSLKKTFRDQWNNFVFYFLKVLISIVPFTNVQRHLRYLLRHI